MHDARDAEDVVRRPATEERHEPDGEVPCARGEAHVAEVDDPGDAVALVEEDVVEREVAVHDLGGEIREAREDALLEAVEEALDELPPTRVLDRVEKLTEPRRLRRVPEEVASRSRVEEPA